MAQLLVRNLDDDVKARLRRRAVRHGRSMEEGLGASALAEAIQFLDARLQVEAA